MRVASNTKLVFLGTGSFAVPILEKLVKSSAGWQTALVVTSPDAPKGRDDVLTPPPVKVAAEKLGLEIYQPASLKTEETVEKIRQIGPTIGILAAYGKIIPESILDLFPKGILNIHPSLLPRWRGPTPIQATILAGDEKAGVTIILMDEVVDHGPIVSKFKIRNSKLETYEILHEKLSEIGADLLMETLPKWLAGGVSPTPQDHTTATFCHKFTREDAKIDWSKSADEIDRRVRALNSEPGTWTSCQMINSKWQIMKILAVTTHQHSQVCKDVVVGGVFEYEKNPAVRCGDGFAVLERVQPEGKKPMTGVEFLRGHSEIIGKILS